MTTREATRIGENAANGTGQKGATSLGKETAQPSTKNLDSSDIGTDQGRNQQGQAEIRSQTPRKGASTMADAVRGAKATKKS